MKVTEAFPGELGKAADHHGLSQRDLLRPRRVRRRGRRGGLFRGRRSRQADPGPGGIAGRSPKSPTTLDPYRYAKADAKGRLVVPLDSPPAQRRDWILNGLATEGGRWTHLTPAQLKAALAEPIVLAGDKPLPNLAGQFSWQVRRELDGILGDPKAAETGGYTVITTLDWKAQQLAERWMTAAAIVPNLPAKQASRAPRLAQDPQGRPGLDLRPPRQGPPRRRARRARLPDRRRPRLRRQRRVHARRPREPQVLAQVRRRRRRPAPARVGVQAHPLHERLRPRPADAGQPAPRRGDQVQRQQGLDSARRRPAGPWPRPRPQGAPVLAERARRSAPWPGSATRTSRTPPRRSASASSVGGTHSCRPAWRVRSAPSRSARSTSSRPTAGSPTAGSTCRRGRSSRSSRRDGRVVWQAPDPSGTKAVSPAGRLPDDRHPGRQHRPEPEPDLGVQARAQQRGQRAPIGRRRSRPALQRSDATRPPTASSRRRTRPTSLRSRSGCGWATATTRLRGPPSPRLRSRRRRPCGTPSSATTPAAGRWRDFSPPSGLVRATIDAWSGGEPGPWTRDTTQAWFIDGTQPDGPHAIDPDGLLYADGCGGWGVDLVQAELGSSSWDADDAGWMDRARRGRARSDRTARRPRISGAARPGAGRSTGPARSRSLNPSCTGGTKGEAPRTREEASAAQEAATQKPRKKPPHH